MADTVCSKFIETADRQSERTAIEFCRRGTWLDVSWRHYGELVANAAAGLSAHGVTPGDRVAIWSNTRLEWAICDLAILSLGAVTVPIYQNSSRDDIEHVLKDSDPKLIFCESPALAARAGVALGGSPDGRAVAWFEAGDESSLEALQTRGAEALKADPELVRRHVNKIELNMPATIVYTSGTTGLPKGVVLTHAQIMSQITEAFPLLGVTSLDKTLSFLPFAHVLGRIEIWGHALVGYTMAYAESVERIKEGLVKAKPTAMIAVPRIFEKIYNGILAQLEISPWRKRVFAWAMSVGREISKRKEEKLPAPLDVVMKYRIAQKLVFGPILEKMGGRLRFCVCGGAPLSQPIAEFFHAAGLLILEGYGLTETTAAICVNTPFDYRFGTVGKPVGEVRLKIASDGEILVKSKKVMTEYYRDPAATAAAFDDGWFKTGDIGEISPDGFLRITDRKKELIKTAGGKYVAPQKLDGLLKANPLISQSLIVGDQRKYVVALITLNESALKNESSLYRLSGDELARSPHTRELVRKAIADANSSLASYESIKNFAILPRDFTVEGGELTPSLKVKRKVVEERYHEAIERLYGVERG